MPGISFLECDDDYAWFCFSPRSIERTLSRDFGCVDVHGHSQRRNLASCWRRRLSRAGRRRLARVGARGRQVRCKLRRLHGRVLGPRLYLQERGDGFVHGGGQSRPDVHLRGDGARAHTGGRRMAVGGLGRLPGPRRGRHQRAQSRSIQVQRELRRQHGGVLDDGLHVQERGDGFVHRRCQSRPDVHLWCTAGDGAHASPAATSRRRQLAVGGAGRLPGPRRGRHRWTESRSVEVQRELCGQHGRVLDDRLHVQERGHKRLHGRGDCRMQLASTRKRSR